MTIDMTNNRVPYGLLTVEEKAALHEHEKAGGLVVVALYDGAVQQTISKHFQQHCVYRTAPLPKTQDVIAWDRLPDWAEWVTRDYGDWLYAWAYEPDAITNGWGNGGNHCRIDEFPGIVVQIGTCDWRDSKQRRPRG
jgi:hypothetical protein